MENGQKMLYVQLQKSMYRKIWAVLFLNQKLLKDLDSQGFEMYPCDLWVVNNIVSGKKMTIIWHVDYLEILNVYDKEAAQIIECKKSVYVKDMRV